jgi:hypothetical protein
MNVELVKISRSQDAKPCFWLVSGRIKIMTKIPPGPLRDLSRTRGAKISLNKGEKNTGTKKAESNLI